MSIPADQIALERANGSGRYSYTFPDGEQAELTFVERGDNVIAMTHTYTPPRHRGQGTAAVLVERAVSEARKTGTRIIPACWFVREQFQLHPEWRDLLHG
jgi:predicted GNAT family acetyltransferase